VGVVFVLWGFGVGGVGVGFFRRVGVFWFFWRGGGVGGGEGGVRGCFVGGVLWDGDAGGFLCSPNCTRPLGADGPVAVGGRGPHRGKSKKIGVGYKWPTKTETAVFFAETCRGPGEKAPPERKKGAKGTTSSEGQNELSIRQVQWKEGEASASFDRLEEGGTLVGGEVKEGSTGEVSQIGERLFFPKTV